MWLSLQILFVYFLALSSLATSSFNFQFLFILVTIPFFTTLWACIHNDSYNVSAIIPPRMVCPFNYQLYCQWLRLYIVIRLSLSVFFLQVHYHRPCILYCMVHDVLSYICVRVVCMPCVIASVFRRIGQLLKHNIVPAYTPISIKSTACSYTHTFDFRLQRPWTAW